MRFVMRSMIFLLLAFKIAMAAEDPISPVEKSKLLEPRKKLAAADLSELSLEQLMDIPVTSVSKIPEKVSEASAAIFVITQDDLRRSGATCIPEALRLAPGVQVARMNTSQWAVSIRGFNDIFANKLLVLIDGRSVYTPNFSGVFWNVQDTMLEDIERIEVIRGPGATMWGANAVNGVINVITKSAKETQGGLVSAGVGTEERGFGSVRYGGQVGKNAYIRGYIKYFDRDDQVLPGGRSAHDEWRGGRGGFRFDWEASNCNQVTLQGDFYATDNGETASVPVLTPPFAKLVSGRSAFDGGNFLGRWTHDYSDTSNSKLQVYYDRTDSDKVAAVGESRNTVDLDFQHQFALGSQHTVLCGAGYRISNDHTKAGLTVRFDPPDRTLDWFSVFLQDKISLLKDKLEITLGVRLEHNDFTGPEIQPTARALWQASSQHTLWAAVSRPVRIPARVEDDVIFNSQALPPGALGPGTPATLARGIGNKDVESENLLAIDVGYRMHPLKRFSLDLAGFYNNYRDLRSTVTGTPFPEAEPAPPHLVLPFNIGNKRRGQSFGGEAMASWQALKWWRLQGQYSFLSIQLKPVTNDPGAEDDEGNSPRNQALVRSSMDLPHNVQLDCALRYVDSLPNRHVSSYVAGDVRIGWRPSKRLELSLVGQNLFDNQHLEWRPTIPINTRPSEVQHSVYFKMTFQF